MHLKFDFRKSHFKNFPGGACPQTPLAWSMLTRAHTTLPQSYWPLHITKASVAPELCISGYNVVRLDRNRHGGGGLLYIVF